MNEASYRAFYGNYPDSDLENLIAAEKENAAHGEKILAERAKARRLEEEKSRIKPGDIVQAEFFPGERFVVLGDDIETAMRAKYHGYGSDRIVATKIGPHHGGGKCFMLRADTVIKAA